MSQIFESPGRDFAVQLLKVNDMKPRRVGEQLRLDHGHTSYGEEVKLECEIGEERISCQGVSMMKHKVRFSNGK